MMIIASFLLCGSVFSEYNTSLDNVSDRRLYGYGQKTYKLGNGEKIKLEMLDYPDVFIIGVQKV